VEYHTSASHSLPDSTATFDFSNVAFQNSFAGLCEEPHPGSESYATVCVASHWFELILIMKNADFIP